MEARGVLWPSCEAVPCARRRTDGDTAGHLGQTRYCWTLGTDKILLDTWDRRDTAGQLGQTRYCWTLGTDEILLGSWDRRIHELWYKKNKDRLDQQRKKGWVFADTYMLLIIITLQLVYRQWWIIQIHELDAVIYVL